MKLLENMKKEEDYGPIMFISVIGMIIGFIGIFIGDIWVGFMIFLLCGIILCIAACYTDPEEGWWSSYPQGY